MPKFLIEHNLLGRTLFISLKNGGFFGLNTISISGEEMGGVGEAHPIWGLEDPQLLCF